MRAKRGFSLIEILVVIIIIGITASFIMFAVGDFGASREVTTSAEKLKNYITLLQQRALLSGENLGLKINNEGYEAYQFSNNKWQPLPKKGIFHFYFFPKKMRVDIKPNPLNSPQIYIYNSGEVSEFTLNFNTASEEKSLKLIGFKNGNLTLVRNQNDR